LGDDAVTSPRKERNLLISVERGVLLRVETAAILLGIGRTKIYELIGRGQISVVRIGRRTLVHRDDLERFGQEQRDRQGDASETPYLRAARPTSERPYRPPGRLAFGPAAEP
jgi:excisionase family DNA binding protein